MPKRWCPAVHTLGMPGTMTCPEDPLHPQHPNPDAAAASGAAPQHKQGPQRHRIYHDSTNVAVKHDRFRIPQQPRAPTHSSPTQPRLEAAEDHTPKAQHTPPAPVELCSAQLDALNLISHNVPGVLPHTPRSIRHVLGHLRVNVHMCVEKWVGGSAVSSQGTHGHAHGPPDIMCSCAHVMGAACIVIHPEDGGTSPPARCSGWWA